MMAVVRLPSPAIYENPHRLMLDGGSPGNTVANAEHQFFNHGRIGWRAMLAAPFRRGRTDSPAVTAQRRLIDLVRIRFYINHNDHNQIILIA